MPWFRAWTLGLVVAVSVLLSGCTTVVAGHAARDKDAVPVDVAPLKESQLGDVLLTADELDTITGSTTMAVTSDVDQLSDSSRLVSDPECLGAIFGAEEQVYGKGLTAVRDQIV